MRERFLQRQPLLKDVAFHDAAKESTSQLPAGLRAVPREVDESGLALVVMPHDDRDSLAMITKGIAMRGQHLVDLEPPDPGEGGEIIIQRVSARLRVQADVRADFRQ